MRATEVNDDALASVKSSGAQSAAVAQARPSEMPTVPARVSLSGADSENIVRQALLRMQGGSFPMTSAVGLSANTPLQKVPPMPHQTRPILSSQPKMDGGKQD